VKTCWLEASAGSGKTTFLLAKLAEFDKSNALCLTFSNAAAHEMEIRAKTLKSSQNCGFYALEKSCQVEKKCQIDEKLYFQNQLFDDQNYLKKNDEKNGEILQKTSQTQPFTRHLAIMTLHSLAFKIVLEKFPFKQISQNSFEKYAILDMLKDSEFKKLILWLFNQSKTASQAKIEPTDCLVLPEICANFRFEHFIPNFDALCGREIIDRDDLQAIKLTFFTKSGTVRKNIKLPASDRVLAANQAEKNDYIEWAIERIEQHEILLEKYLQWVKNNLFSLVKLQEQRLKDADNFVYYEDLLKIAIEILKNHENADVFFKFFGNLDLILIDESQDLAPLQWEFLQTILTDWKDLGGRLIVAGDPKQLIYQFQGANLESYYASKAAIQAASSEFENKSLNYTYRLPERICHFVNAVGENFEMDFQEHKTASKNSGQISFFYYKDFSQIVELVSDKVGQNGGVYDAIARDARTEQNSGVYDAIAKVAKLEQTTKDAKSEPKNGQKMIRTIEQIYEENIEKSAKNAGKSTLSYSQIMILFKQKTDRMAKLAHKFFANGFLINSPYSLQHPMVHDFRYLLRFLVFSDIPKSAKMAKFDAFSLAIIFNVFGKTELKKDDFADQKELKFLESLRPDLKNIQNLCQKWLTFPLVADFLKSKLGNGYDFWCDILFRYASFYKYDPIGAISDERDFYKENGQLFADGIFFNTIHSSKGMEADCVILLDCDHKNKFKNDTESLLYVGITRTKNELIIPLFNGQNGGVYEAIARDARPEQNGEIFNENFIEKSTENFESCQFDKNHEGTWAKILLEAYEKLA